MEFYFEEVKKKTKKSHELPNNISKIAPPLVSVFTITYQHSNYIEECIEGVLAQKTKFLFEYIIGEDFSDDGTREIVFEYAKKYPDRIRVITENYNVGGRKNLIRCIKASRGKYIAICEGDDYWTDPYKLQRQVDVLEKNNSLAICAHRVKCFYQDEFLPSYFSKKEKEIGGLADILERNYLHTCSVLIRKSAIQEDRFEKISAGLIQGDWPLYVFTAEKGKIFFINKVMGVYRIHKGGVWNSLSSEEKLKHTIRARKTIIGQVMGLSKKERKRLWFINYLNWARCAEKESKIITFYLLFKAFLINPSNVKIVFKNILFTIYNFFYSFARRIVFYFKKKDWGENKTKRILINFFIWPFDFLSVIRSYKKEKGNYPNIIFPKTFSEKIQRNKLFFRKERYTIFGDKLAVRDYVAKKIGSQFLTKVYWIGKDLKGVNKDNLPKKFVIKLNHGCDHIIFVKDKENFDWQEAYKATNQWLKKDYSHYRGEWHYRWIDSFIFIEEYLEENGDIPINYKFFCFNGKVKMIQVDFNRFPSHSRILFDHNFKPLKVRLKSPLYKGKVVKPHNFEKMREFAEKLSFEEPFLIVNFYDIKKVVFGKIILYPKVGSEVFHSYIWDYKVGKFMS